MKGRCAQGDTSRMSKGNGPMIRRGKSVRVKVERLLRTRNG